MESSRVALSPLGPNTATELVKITRGRLPACRQASSSRREPVDVDPHPQLEIGFRLAADHGSQMEHGVDVAGDRGRQHAGARDVTREGLDTRIVEARRLFPVQQNELPAVRARSASASRRPRKPPAPVMSTFIRRVSACFWHAQGRPKPHFTRT